MSIVFKAVWYEKKDLSLNIFSHLSGSCSAFAKYCNSFFRRKPLALWSKPSPIIELWALCAVPIERMWHIRNLTDKTFSEMICLKSLYSKVPLWVHDLNFQGRKFVTLYTGHFNTWLSEKKYPLLSFFSYMEIWVYIGVKNFVKLITVNFTNLPKASLI